MKYIGNTDLGTAKPFLIDRLVLPPLLIQASHNNTACSLKSHLTKYMNGYQQSTSAQILGLLFSAYPEKAAFTTHNNTKCQKQLAFRCNKFHSIFFFFSAFLNKLST
jgi:hypothetical protein